MINTTLIFMITTALINITMITTNTTNMIIITMIMMMMIRNILHVPDNARTGKKKCSNQNQIMWNLFAQVGFLLRFPSPTSSMSPTHALLIVSLPQNLDMTILALIRHKPNPHGPQP